MKNLISILIVCIAIFFVTGCEEIHEPLELPKEEIVDTTANAIADYILTDTILEVEAKQSKIVLLEEFTGVRCPNCPDGTIHAENLSDQNPGKLKIVSIHSGFFSIPYTGDQDLKIEDGSAIEQFLGTADAFPSASINRNLFDGNTEIIMTSVTGWTNGFNAENDTETKVNVEVDFIENDDAEDRVEVKMHFTENVEGITKYTVYVLENNIIATQDVNGTVTEDYVHKHVLRRVLTNNADGDILKLDANAGDTFEASIAFKDVEEIWNLSNVEIVAFVHKSGAEKTILQVGSKKLND